MSAGHVPVTSSHTIHYRPDTFDISLPAQQYSQYTAVLGPATNGELSQHSSYRNTPIPQVLLQYLKIFIILLYLQTFYPEAFLLDRVSIYQALIETIQSDADCVQTDFSRLINPVDDELVDGVTAVVAEEAKNKDDDLDLALNALRDCDTDFMKFDQV